MQSSAMQTSSRRKRLPHFRTFTYAMCQAGEPNTQTGCDVWPLPLTIPGHTRISLLPRAPDKETAFISAKDLTPGCKLDVQEHVSAPSPEKTSVRRIVHSSERYQRSQDTYPSRYWRSKVISPVCCERLIRLPQAIPVTFLDNPRFVDQGADTTFVRPTEELFYVQ